MWKAEGVDGVARRLAAAPGQPPVYVYRFDWGSLDADGKSVEPADWGRRLGAFHGLEIPFMLGQDKIGEVGSDLIFTRANAPGRKALSWAMMRYEAQFAKTGNPNPPGPTDLPEWQPWSNQSGGPKYISFDASADYAFLRMSRAELTPEEVMASLEKELSEPLLGQVKGLLSLGRKELE